MTKKKVDEDGTIENNTGTELQILQNIEKAYYKNNSGAKRRNTEKSLKWFSKYVPRSYNKVRTARLMRDRDLWMDRIQPGTMMTFEYDPIHKDSLPVYDTMPLVFAWDVWKGGQGKFGEAGKTYFIGINLHYLPPALRFLAMKTLLKKKNEKRYRKNTRLKISWQVLQALANSKYFEHSVKMYRMDHVRSKFIKIPAQSWELALFLPTARFKKGGKSAAWKVS